MSLEEQREKWRQEWLNDPRGQYEQHKMVVEAGGGVFDIENTLKSIFDVNDPTQKASIDVILAQLGIDLTVPEWAKCCIDIENYIKDTNPNKIPFYYQKVINDKKRGAIKDPNQIGAFQPALMALYLMINPEHSATVIKHQICMWDTHWGDVYGVKCAHYQVGEENVEHVIRRICEELCPADHMELIPDTKQIKEVMNQIYQATPPALRTADSDPMLIPYLNGVIDMNKYMEGDVHGCLMEDKPEYRLTNVIPWSYNPDVTSCDIVDNFFASIACGKDARIANLWEFIAQCTLRANWFQVTPLLYGPKGSCGKTTYMGFVAALLGKHNVSAEPPNRLDNPFAVWHLVGKLANLSGEVSATLMTPEMLSTWKSISGGDNISFDKKHSNVDMCDSISTTLGISCNTLPRFSHADANGGTLRRFDVAINFKASFTNDADARIKEKLKTPECMAYAINKSLDALGRMIATNKPNPYTENSDFEEILQEMTELNDSVESFFAEYGVEASWFTCGIPRAAIVQLTGSTHAEMAQVIWQKVPEQQVFDEYDRFCRKQGRPRVNITPFCNRAKQRFNLERTKDQVKDPRYNNIRHRTFYDPAKGKPDYTETVDKNLAS